MSLHTKAYKEPEAVFHDPDVLLRHVQLLRKALDTTIRDYIEHGERSYPRHDIQKLAFDALAETKGLYSQV